MRRRSVRGLGLGLVLGVALLGAPGPAPTQVLRPLVTGRVVSGDEATVAGALVTLHEEGDRRPRAHTYTAADGTFTLAAPPEAGSYVVVATAGGRTGRRVFTREPAAALQYLVVPLTEEPPAWRQALEFAGDKLDALLGTVLGLVAGFFLRRWEERSKARRTVRVRSAALRASAERARRALRALAGEERVRSGGTVTAEGHGRILEGLRGALDEIAREREKLLAVEGLVVPALGWPSTGDYGDLQEELRTVEELRSRLRLDGEALEHLDSTLGRLESHRFLER